MRLLAALVALLAWSCASDPPRVIGEVPKRIKEVFDFKNSSSIEVCEALRESFGEKYPAVRFTPDRRVKRVYLRYDDDYTLPPEALQAMRKKVEDLDRSE